MWKTFREHGGDARVLLINFNGCLQSCATSATERMMNLYLWVVFYSKWRTTPVVEEVFAEVSAQGAAVGAVDAAEAVVGDAVPGEASPKTRK